MAERIDRERSRERIERDVETLAGPAYTLSDSAICRYAYTDVYRNTLAYFTAELEQHRVHRLAGPGRDADRLERRPGRARRSASARTATRTATAASTTARSASARRSRSAGWRPRPATACRCG